MVVKNYIMRNGLAQDPVRQCDLLKPSGSLASAVTTVCLSVLLLAQILQQQ